MRLTRDLRDCFRRRVSSGIAEKTPIESQTKARRRFHGLLIDHHLRKLRALIDRVEPAVVSEHLSWSGVDGEYWRDLLPMPHSEAAIAHLVSRIGQAQDALRRNLLVENVSSYLRFAADECPEWLFVREVARRSGERGLQRILASSGSS